ncbi:MAG: hypothetical protein KatS3mg105_3367 [Gemmatales bacterium]|nr:MAG: hypothetical protein KatS3mg105_3367 [Gemmatales bacterium]
MRIPHVGLCLLLQLAILAQATEAQFRRPRSRSGGEAAHVGKTAPDFTLQTLDGKSRVRLSSFAGKKPVALIFGSYT